MHNILFTFQTTHQALSAEKKMKMEPVSSRLIPTPTEIFAECGFSLELTLDEEKIEQIARGELFPYAECYLIAKSENRSTLYEKIYSGCP